MKLTDPRQFGLGAQRRNRPPRRGQSGDDRVHQPHRHPAKAGRAAEQREQRFTLLARRDCRAGPADRQDAVASRVVAQATGDVIGEIVVADRLARGPRSVAE